MKKPTKLIRSKQIVFALSLLLFVAWSQTGCAQANAKNEVSDGENTTNWEFVGATRFFDKPVVESDIAEFKKITIQFVDDTIIIHGKSKAVFTERDYAAEKYFGKGSLYQYYTRYLLDKYNIDVSKTVHYIELQDEDRAKEGFKPFFLMSDAVYTGKYLFLYRNDDYLLTFIKADGEGVSKNRDTLANDRAVGIQPSKYTLPYDKKIDPMTIKYDSLESDISGIERFKSGETTLRYISLPNKNDISVILVPMDSGDFSYRYYMLTIKNSNVVSDLYVEGEWWEPESTEIEKTSFSIDENYKIKVTSSYQNNESITYYTITEQAVIKEVK